GVDLQQLATAYAVDHRLVRTSADLDDELARTPAGLRLVEVRTDRAANAELHRRLGEAAAATLR
ncbi:MAG: hypothetical protein QOJ03_1498, partial [Frankiaceae bacterium]|nr:hypothetical protein [Frankiaceae bacterium]